MQNFLEALSALQNTPIPSIIGFGGIVFLLFGFSGGIKGKMELPLHRQRWAMILGAFFLVIGIAISLPNLPNSRISMMDKSESLEQLSAFKSNIVELSLDSSNNMFYPSEEIILHFKINSPSTFSEKAWVGIIPHYVKHGDENENDKYDIDFKYLKKRDSGVLRFKAPMTAGAYDFRMHNTNLNGIEVASIHFIVSPLVNQHAGQPITYSHIVEVKGAPGINLRTKDLSKKELDLIVKKVIPDSTYLTTLMNGTRIVILDKVRDDTWLSVIAQYGDRYIMGYIAGYYDNKQTVKPI